MRAVVLLSGLLVLGASIARADTPDAVAPVSSRTEAPGAEADPEMAEHASGAFRVENEFKLFVPDADCEPLREFLEKRYGKGEESILPQFGQGFSAVISDEAFVDHYFDTPDLAVLGAEGGVRHRSRRNLGDASKDRKHGRQLLQFKLRRPGDKLLNRTEIKFEVDPPDDRKSDLDRHPMIGLVDRDEQQAVIRTAAQYGFDATKMQRTLTITQRRWRVYVSRDGKPFSTLTLDEVDSHFLLSSVQFVELEIELNEIAYTEARPADRTYMESISLRMAEDIFATFPSIKQDQTPKYNKVYNAFAKKLPKFDVLVLYGESVGAILLVGLPALVLAVWGAVSAVRRRLAERRRRAKGLGSLAGPPSP